MPALATTLAALHALGWAAYLGGAMFMELVWRPAQEHIPPSQINVLCQRMGQRYRWLALTALGLIAMTGVGLLLVEPAAQRPPVTLSSSYWRTMLALALCWVALVTLVAVMAVVAHPALHARTPAEMTPEERAAAREVVRRAIRRMDVLLRCELAVGVLAAALGASLRLGGVL